MGPVLVEDSFPACPPGPAVGQFFDPGTDAAQLDIATSAMQNSDENVADAVDVDEHAGTADPSACGGEGRQPTRVKHYLQIARGHRALLPIVGCGAPPLRLSFPTYKLLCLRALAGMFDH